MHIQPILKKIQKADRDFNLIEDNDKICVGLSGGKDSMLLWVALHTYARFSKHPFSVVAIHVDMGFDENENAVMENFAKEHQLNLYIEKTQIYSMLQKHLTKDNRLPCSLCSTLKKGVLFEKAKALGCSKIALGHHGDDAIETLFLNMIHGGRIATFQPRQYMSRMDMDMIRPMVYIEEKEIETTCKNNAIPAIKKLCPNDGKTQRHVIKHELEALYARHPQAHERMLDALSNTEQVQLWNKAGPDR